MTEKNENKNEDRKGKRKAGGTAAAGKAREDARYDFTQELPAIDVDAMRAMSVKRHAKRRRTAALALSAAISGLLVVACGVASAGWIDTGTVRQLLGEEAGAQRPVVYSQVVGRAESSQYCPQRMRLADTGTYGDSAYQASEGDAASRTLIAAAGQVSAAVASPLAATASAVSILDGSGAPVSMLDTQQTDTTALVASAAFDSSQDGTGLLGTVSSQATQGDLQGLAATGCVAAASSQRLIVPSTRVGWTEQLVIANPSTTSTLVDLTVWGTTQQGELALSTDARVAVPAGGETVVSLAAAATAQEALVVDVDSETLPVAAVVRSVFVNGLQPRGSEYITATAPAAATQLIGALGEGQDLELTLFSQDEDAQAKILWVTPTGRQLATTVPLEAGRVSLTELDERPEQAYALAVESDKAVNAQVRGTADGGQQSDFSISQTTPAARVAGLAVPGGLEGDVIVGNTGDSPVTVSIASYGEGGAQAASTDVQIPADSAIRVALSDLGGGTAQPEEAEEEGQGESQPLVITATLRTSGTAGQDEDADGESGEGDANGPDGTVTLAARLTSPAVDAASLQGTAIVHGASLDAQSGAATARRDQRIIG